MRYSLLTGLSIIAFTAAGHATDSAAAQKTEHAAQHSAEAVETPVGEVYVPVARDGELIDSTGGGAIEPVLPVIQKAGGISYITGGVGQEELDALKAQAANFNVRILLTSIQGEFMGDTIVRFLNKEGVEIFRVYEAGPYFYANLPAGKYRVEVAAPSGEIQKKNITAPATIPKSGKIVLRFKE